jgi:threonine dehydrogenase-like Zn-dependent dehydrogenase
MRATLYGGPGDITVGERPDPRIATPADAVVRVTLGCVCGSDLWYYRGTNPHALGPIGHEFIGVVEQVGADVTTLQPGDLVVAPFTFCDGTCANCVAGWTGNCSTAVPSATTASTAVKASTSASRTPTPPWSRCPAAGAPTPPSSRWSPCPM